MACTTTISANARALRRILLEPRDRHGPRLLARLHIGAVVAGLRAEEAVRRPFEDVRLVGLPELFHLGFRRRDGVAYARILRQAAIQAGNRRFGVRDAIGDDVRRWRRAARGRWRVRRRLTVVDDRRVQPRFVDGKREALRAAEAEADARALAVRPRILQAPLAR